MIPSSVNRIIYRGNGIAKEFSYPFKIFDRTDIKLLRIGKDGTRENVTTDYYIDTEAKKVYYPGYAPGAVEPNVDQHPVLAPGETLVIYRDVPINQLASMPAQWPFDVNEDMHDKSCVIDQQLADGVARSLKFGEEFNATEFDPTLPIKAGYGWRISDDGKSIVPIKDVEIVLAQTEAVYSAAVRDTTQIYNSAVADTEKVRQAAIADTKKIYDDAVRDTTQIYNNAVNETRQIYNSAVADTRQIYNNAVIDTTAIKEQTQGISDVAEGYKNQAKASRDEAQRFKNDAIDYASLAERWAQASDAPDYVLGNRSSKTWAELSQANAMEAGRQADKALALASQAQVYDDSVTYSPADVVMTPDGATYRCIQESTGENPRVSNKWALVSLVISDTFELDDDGDLMPLLNAASTNDFDIDIDGDIMPAL